VIALLAMTASGAAQAQSPPAAILGFSIDPAAAEFGAPIAPGSAVTLRVSGYGACRVSFLARPAKASGAEWREAGTAEGPLPLSARLAPLSAGEHRLTFRSDCQAGRFRQEISVRVADVPAQPRLQRFEDKEALWCSRLPLGAPARIEAERSGGKLTVTVLSNFGCQTTAGEATVWRDGETLALFARTLLPGHPTPHCLCTRELRYVVGDADATRIRYQQDQRPAVEATFAARRAR
jgi:hypothetical protein